MMRAVQWGKAGARDRPANWGTAQPWQWDAGAAPRRRWPIGWPEQAPPVLDSPPGASWRGEEVSRMDQTVARGSSADGSRFSRLWPLVWLAWLPALIPSLTSLLRAHPAPLRL